MVVFFVIAKSLMSGTIHVCSQLASYVCSLLNRKSKPQMVVDDQLQLQLFGTINNDCTEYIAYRPYALPVTLSFYGHYFGGQISITFNGVKGREVSYFMKTHNAS